MPNQQSKSSTRAERDKQSRALIEGAFETARELGVDRFLILADRAGDTRLVQKLRQPGERVLWLSRGDAEVEEQQRGDKVLHLPDVRLSRSSQMSMALLLATLTTTLEVEEAVLCLSGPGGGGAVDTLTLARPRSRFPWLTEADLEVARSVVGTPTFARVLTLALRLAAEGREGRPVGTALVIGAPDDLEPYTRQLILNPCQGHPRKARNVHNPLLFETVRELVAMDGALIVTPKGVLESAGTYLAPTVKRLTVTRGLGARHAAAAGITAQAPCVAVVVSESSGTVTTYHEGQAILSLERPALTGASVKVRRP